MKKRFLYQLSHFIHNAGINPKQFFLSFKGISHFIRNYFSFRNQFKNNEKLFAEGNLMPCLADRYATAGDCSNHYFYQDVFIASLVYKNNPVRHIDIGSRMDGFVTHVASFREIEVFDIREYKTGIKNIKFVKADLMLPDEKLIEYADSVSCLHAIEHFGLGRYGDPIDFWGFAKGLDNIYKILKKNGKFYFSVPIGLQRIEFDAHRVFSVKYLCSLLSPKYSIDSFSYIDDNGIFFESVQLNDGNIQNNFNCNYGCGIFELTKL